MARPKKTGLDYFPFDVDFFEDEKTVCIAGEFGIKGEMAIIKLLCAIYRNGYFIEWNEAVKMKMLRQMPGISAELFDQILNRLVRWGFFDASLFDSVKVLTSEGIQRRYFSITRNRTKREKSPYLLVFDTETPVFDAETPVFDAETPKSKVNKIKKISPDGDMQKSARQGSLFKPEELKGKRSKKKKIPADSAPGPTLEEVKKYFLSQDADKRLENWELVAMQFYDYFNAADWRDGLNRKITRWDSRANTWIFKEEEIRKKEKLKNETKAQFKSSVFLWVKYLTILM